MVTKNFWNFKGTKIFSEQNWKVSLDHAITVVGWGKSEDGEEYWIMRNSWGTMWGDGGFAKIKMWSDNVGIESDCGYIIPADLK
jgi:C1A family cysteine protease